MYSKTELKKMLFFDLETAAQFKSIEDLKKTKPEMYKLWKTKYHDKHVVDKHILAKIHEMTELDGDGSLVENLVYVSCAGLYPEFGKIVCAVFGTLDDNLKIQAVDIADHNELEILDAVKTYLNTQTDLNLAGYNIKGFDIPFICKRMLLTGKVLPKPLQIKGLKPWEMKFVDLMEDWKFGGFSNNISLDLMCNAFDVPTPKDGIQNHEVGREYYNNKKGLEIITEYCIKDVIATIKVALKVSGLKETIEVKETV